MSSQIELPRVVVDRLVTNALEEDLAAGDATTEACIDPASVCLARGVARKSATGGSLVFCGASVAEAAFRLVDPSLRFTVLVQEGTCVPPKTEVFRVEGRARSVLMAERVALNFLQRMSGIATLTKSFVDAVSTSSRTRITDTRKTTPGLRILERYAVRAGGGKNHREHLGAAILIKDNHIAACGGIRAAILRAKDRAPHTSKVECEVDTLEGLDMAIDAGADIVMLDNFSDADVKAAVARASGRVFLEVSGGITLDRVTRLSEFGVDAISVGALTHSAVASDLALDF